MQEGRQEEEGEAEVAAHWQEVYYTLLILEKVLQHAPQQVSHVNTSSDKVICGYRTDIYFAHLF